MVRVPAIALGRHLDDVGVVLVDERHPHVGEGVGEEGWEVWWFCGAPRLSILWHQRSSASVVRAQTHTHIHTRARTRMHVHADIYNTI